MRRKWTDDLRFDCILNIQLKFQSKKSVIDGQIVQQIVHDAKQLSAFVYMDLSFKQAIEQEFGFG